ncbi:hypothetical protein [Mucilaginibacter aquatilis]|uniref:Uncharacterized protein n=1 Tax=Mucilaginibacter aquatilis TaxID=1517760 RepID=A0A6I4IEP2_9SPHI|nr:hypothetical protein [Mucilaginibacter aquatilis]MVN92248.1 hypothetical protein [Mucilaginibacter aquatilis]
MKRLLFLATILLCAMFTQAQQQMPFPFQGGKDVMMTFFKENVVLPKALKDKKATGTAVIKFTADPKGAIQKIVVYYADDYSIAMPFIEALKKSDKKWIIFDGEKVHDFIISCTINLTPGNATAAVQKQVYESYNQRKPIFASNPIPLDMATLLPAIITTY